MIAVNVENGKNLYYFRYWNLTRKYNEYYSHTSLILASSVEEAYDETKLQFTVLNPDKSYRRGAYDSILLFRTSSIGTEFFRISVTSISDLNSINNSYTLSNGKYIVWIKEKGSHIYILETEGVFNKKWAIYSLIGSVISTLIYFFIRYRKKIVFNFS